MLNKQKHKSNVYIYIYIYIYNYICVIVVTPLPGHYRVYTHNNIHNSEGVARWIMNVTKYISIMPMKVCYNWFILKEPYRLKVVHWRNSYRLATIDVIVTGTVKWRKEARKYWSWFWRLMVIHIHQGPSTSSVLAGLQRSMLDHNNRLSKFLDQTNLVFCPIYGACAGIGTNVCHITIIREEEEAKLWEKRILGVDNPKSLQRAIRQAIDV